MKVDFSEELFGKNVIVSGGMGFVGHNLVKELVDKYNCKVTVIDDLSNSNSEVLENYLHKINFLNISILELDKIKSLLKECDYFFHLACVQINHSSNDPIKDLQVNAESTLQILEFYRKNKNTNLKRFVFTSSASVYGSNMNIPLGENSRINILSHYAATKFLGENYTELYNLLYNIPTIIVRYSNVYGFGQTTKNPYCGVVGKFIDAAFNKEAIIVYGDGEQTRDYTFITDAIDATILAAIHPRAYGEIFNIGTGVETSVNQIIKILTNYFSDLIIKYEPERHIDNIRRRAVNIEHIHKRLGWSPKINIEQGIKKTIDWYRNNIEKIK